MKCTMQNFDMSTPLKFQFLTQAGGKDNRIQNCGTMGKSVFPIGSCSRNDFKLSYFCAYFLIESFTTSCIAEYLSNNVPVYYFHLL